jgi:3-oxoacyl-[acyl-carrier protein] reductase
MKKVAVVVGGFGEIGYGIVEALDALDYAIVVLSRSADSPTNKDKLAKLNTDQKLGIVCDITKSSEIEAARDIVLKNFGSVDVIVNSAADREPVSHKNLDELTDEIFDKTVISCLRGVHSVVRTFHPHLKEDSVIVNISSASAQRRGGSSMAYAAAKAGVESLTRNYAVTFAPKTRVVSVAPGFVDTIHNVNPARHTALMNTPMGRVASIADVVDTVMFAINHKFITGNSILVDGGRGV